MKRVCYFCKHFEIDNGEPHYSDYTPGYDWAMFCKRSVWDFEGTYHGREYFKKCLETAETCEHFEDRQESD